MLNGYFILIFSMVLSGLLGIFARWINLPPVILLFYRFLFSLIFIYPFLRFSKEEINLKKAFTNRYMWILCISNVLSAITYFYALTFTSIANTVILFNTGPIMLALLAPFVLKEQLEKTSVISLILSFIGVILITSPSSISIHDREFLGILAGLGSAFTYATLMLASKKLKGFSASQIVFSTSLAGAVSSFPFILTVPYTMTVPKLSLLILFGFVTALTFVLFFKGAQMIKTQHTGVLQYLETVFAILFAFLIFQEIPPLATLIGGVLIIGGGYLVIKNK